MAGKILDDTRMEDCWKFQKCDAPLCPLDPDLEKRIWIAGEPICRRRFAEVPRWLEMQRRYQRLEVEGYFRVKGGKLVRYDPEKRRMKGGVSARVRDKRADLGEKEKVGLPRLRSRGGRNEA